MLAASSTQAAVRDIDMFLSICLGLQQGCDPRCLHRYLLAAHTTVNQVKPSSASVLSGHAGHAPFTEKSKSFITKIAHGPVFQVVRQPLTLITLLLSL